MRGLYAWESNASPFVVILLRILGAGERDKDEVGLTRLSDREVVRGAGLRTMARCSAARGTFSLCFGGAVYEYPLSGDCHDVDNFSGVVIPVDNRHRDPCRCPPGCRLPGRGAPFTSEAGLALQEDHAGLASDGVHLAGAAWLVDAEGAVATVAQIAADEGDRPFVGAQVDAGVFRGEAVLE